MVCQQEQLRGELPCGSRLLESLTESDFMDLTIDEVLQFSKFGAAVLRILAARLEDKPCAYQTTLLQELRTCMPNFTPSEGQGDTYATIREAKLRGCCSLSL